jgi:hypothetical protein
MFTVQRACGCKWSEPHPVTIRCIICGWARDLCKETVEEAKQHHDTTHQEYLIVRGT